MPRPALSVVVLALAASLLPAAAPAQGWERTYTISFTDCPAPTRQVLESELTRLHGYRQLRPVTCGPTRCKQSYVSTLDPADLVHALYALTEASGQRARVGVDGLRMSVTCLPGQRVHPRADTPAPPFVEYRAPCGTIFEMGGEVLFDFDSARIRSTAVPALAALAERIRAERPAAVEITGHTDARGSRAYNRGLSERRARSVARYLSVTPGLAAQRFLVRGLGEESPRAPNTLPDGRDNPAGRQANRRVEIVLSTPGPGCPGPAHGAQPLDPARW